MVSYLGWIWLMLSSASNWLGWISWFIATRQAGWMGSI